MSNPSLAILGGGNMGRALIGGLLRHGTRPEHIYVGETSAAARATLIADFGIQATADNAAAVEPASVVVLAVKPQTAAQVLGPLRPLLQRNRPVVVSIAAGIRLESLELWCGDGVPVIRSMPNAPALVGAGATGLFAPDSVGESQREAAERIMRAVGEVVWVGAEAQLDIVTALSGSGPAYFFLFTELLAQSAAALGLDARVADRLAKATLHGAGQLALAGDGDLARLRAQVTSKGGTTEAALRSFEAVNFPGVVAQAVEAAARRSGELADRFGHQPAGNP